MVTRPKGKLAALLAIFAAIGIVTATGAFTSVSAQRTVSVNVSGDSAALLELEPNGTSQNGDAYAQISNGQLIIDLNGNLGDNSNAEGLNPDANTTLTHLVNITNQGTQGVYVSATVKNSNGVKIYPMNGTSVGLNSSAAISPGASVSLGLKINTTGLSGTPPSDFNTTLVIEADQSQGYNG